MSVSVLACLTGWYARSQQRIALLAAVPFLSVTYVSVTSSELYTHSTDSVIDSIIDLATQIIDLATIDPATIDPAIIEVVLNSVAVWSRMEGNTQFSAQRTSLTVSALCDKGIRAGLCMQANAIGDHGPTDDTECPSVHEAPAVPDWAP